MNRLDEQYRGLLGEVLYNGVEKKDRTGSVTYSRFGFQFFEYARKFFVTTKRILFNKI